MENFEKNVYMQGCHLIVRMLGDISDTYQFVFNSETEEFSDIYLCEPLMDYELDTDGHYTIVTFKKNVELSDGKVTLGQITYTAEEISQAIASNTNILFGADEFDLDEMLSICELKRCLAELELRNFNENVKNCGKKKCKTNEYQSQMNFIFIAVWLMEHYIDLGNIDKAMDIYESLKSCGSLCNTLLNNKNNCGCNG